ncbi:hypothetical protein GCM10023199_30490 [Actinomycetospora chibensis]
MGAVSMPLTVTKVLVMRRSRVRIPKAAPQVEGLLHRVERALLTCSWPPSWPLQHVRSFVAPSRIRQRGSISWLPSGSALSARPLPRVVGSERDTEPETLLRSEQPAGDEFDPLDGDAMRPA